MYVFMNNCLRSESESASLVTTTAQRYASHLCMSARVCADSCRANKSGPTKKQIRPFTLVKNKYDCVFTERKGKRYTSMHAHASVYACTHRSSTTCQGCPSVHYMSMCNKHLMLGQITGIYTYTYTHSHTFNTFTQAQYSGNSHDKHTHSLK
jgi:hypothetical protein